MNGVFNVKLMEDGGIPDAVWREACRAKACRELLEGRKTLLEARSENLVFDNFTGWMFRKLMSGGGITQPFDRESGSAYLATIHLENLSTDPTYQEFSGEVYTSPAGCANIVTSDGWKRFVEDDIDTPEIAVGLEGRESVVFRSRYLWTPLQAVSTSIYSIAAWFCADGNTSSSNYRTRATRTRLKDSQGRKIRISKSSRQVLVVEYEFTLVAI